MNDFKLTSKVKKIALMMVIGFVLYNVILFSVSGFDFHGPWFWISYVFVIIAFLALAATAYALKSRNIQPRDWLLGYPILKHTAIYIIAELILSTIFMLLDSFDFAWWIPFVAQTIALALYAIFAISCFLTQETIVDVQTKVKDATSFIKLLQVDVEMAAEKINDAEAKAAFTKLAEQVRYSDPMSNDNLFELEKQITLQVSNADSCITLNDIDGAVQCCNRAALLLTERNKKCKALK